VNLWLSILKYNLMERPIFVATDSQIKKKIKIERIFLNRFASLLISAIPLKFKICESVALYKLNSERLL